MASAGERTASAASEITASDGEATRARERRWRALHVILVVVLSCSGNLASARSLSLEVWSRTEADVFAKLHKIPSQIDVLTGTVSLKGMGEMKEQCLLYPQESTAHCIL